MRKIAVIVLGLIILSGCSTYQLSGQRKETIVEKISPNTITVTFCGNAYMSKKEVDKYALQRASREALSKGCSHFMIVKKQDSSKMCALGYKMGKTSYTDSSTAKNAELLPSSEFEEPNVTLTIRCIPKGEKIPEGAIDARQFLSENFPGLEK